MKWATLFTLATAFSLETPQDGAVKLGFDIYRGNHKQDLRKRDTRRPFFAKRDDSVTMELQNQQNFYLTELKIGGTDSVGVLVDTGSSDLWVMSHDIVCKVQSTYGMEATFGQHEVLFDPRPSKTLNKDAKDEVATVAKDYTITMSYTTDDSPLMSAYSALLNGGSSTTDTCTDYGSFSTAGSDSFKVNSTAETFGIAYGDGTTATGFWGHDDVEIANSSVIVKDLSFAVVNNTSSNVGVLGIGLPGLETTYSTYGGGGYQYENLPMKMKAQGLIKKNAYSLYLGSEDDETGHILFGAVDHAKYSGTLATVPIVNTQRSKGYTTAIRLEIVLDSIVLSGNTNVSVTSNSYSALLDTGTTLSYFPTALFSKVADMVGAEYSRSYGAYFFDCPSSSDNRRLVLNFSGQKIEVPISALSLSLSSSMSQCVFGVFPQESTYILFGDNVLRSMYVVYDLDDLEVSLAPAKYSDSEDIEVISSSVPGATKAAGYSSTALSSVSEGSYTRRVSGSATATATNTSTKDRSGGSVEVVSWMSLLFSVVLGML